MSSLLTAKELLSKEFLSFLVRSYPDLRKPVLGWAEQANKAGPGLSTQQQFELLSKVLPAGILSAAQEEWVSKGKPGLKQAAGSSSSSLAPAAAAMQPGGSGNLSQLTPQQQQQLLQLRGQQAQGQAAQPGAWPGLMQQQPPARTVSPVPTAVPTGQQAGAAANQSQAAMYQQLLRAAGSAGLTPQQAAALAAQQQARTAGLPGAPAGTQRAPGAAGLPSVGSAGNLAALNPAAALAAAAAAAAGGVSLQQRPGSAGGLRPVGSGGPGAGLYGRPGGGPDPDAGTKAQVQAVLRSLKPNEPPKVEPPDGCEWVQCTGKDGKPGWFAVVRAKASVLRAKRKAEDAPAGQPPGKQGGRGKGAAAADDELVAGGGPLSMNVMDEDAVEAEEAAAKATIVVEAGNVQEEYLLAPTATMRLVARAAKEAGVKAVSDSVYPYLSLAAEAFLGQLLNSMVKMRLQREDLGKSYFGFEQGDTTLRADMYKHREREKREAEKRAEMERDELAKLGTSRKKLGEEERKAAHAAKQQREMEQKKASVGSTLSKLGIGHQGFSSFSKAATRTGSSKPGFTKSELADLKAAGDPQPASTTAPAAAAAASTAAAAASAQAAGAGVKAEAGTAADPQAGAAAAQGLQPGSGSLTAAASSSAAAAAEASPAALRAMTLQHQLLSTADVAAQGASFVAGGAGPTASRKPREGDPAFPRELMLADLVAVLERHPLYCRSPELYTLYTLAALQADNATSSGK